MKAHRWTDEELQDVKAKRVKNKLESQALQQLERVRGGVNGRPEGLKAWRATDPLNARPDHAEGTHFNPSPTKHPYKSKLELAWAMRLEVMKRNGEIDGWIYEPFTFRLAEGKRYRADFIAWNYGMVTHPDGSVELVKEVIAYECKGWHKNYRDSLTHLKWAAQRFPFFQWKKVVRNGKSGFEVYDVVV